MFACLFACFLVLFAVGLVIGALSTIARYAQFGYALDESAQWDARIQGLIYGPEQVEEEEEEDNWVVRACTDANLARLMDVATRRGLVSEKVLIGPEEWAERETWQNALRWAARARARCQLPEEVSAVEYDGDEDDEDDEA